MRGSIVAIAFCFLVGMGAPLAPVNAADPVTTVVKGCKTELTTYCSRVRPGHGRLLACLYAHGDKLSGRCDYALYDAAAQLQRAVAALSFVASECAGDIRSLCANIAVGGGRIAACLSANESKVSARCLTAAKDVGLR